MAIDWTKSMKQTYEVYTVDPATWLNDKYLDTVTGASITRDISSDTVVSGSIDYVGELNEEYVRVYLVAEQDDEVERVPLITMLCQTPSTEYNGKYTKTSITGYSPIIELEGEYPPIGYTIPKNYPSWLYPTRSDGLRVVTRIDEFITDITRSYCRAPVITMTELTDVENFNGLYQDYVAGKEDNWFSIVKSMLERVNYKFMVDPMGNISFYKQPQYTQMQPKWTYSYGNSSILTADISIDRDLYNMPNVVELIVTTNAGQTISVAAENHNTGSIMSIENRGRRVVKREIDPAMLGTVSKNIDTESLLDYAKELLVQYSSLAYTVSYSHGYCPVTVGDCVIINYEDAGIHNERAYVISQSIDCTTGCKVNETAMFVRSYYTKE